MTYPHSQQPQFPPGQQPPMQPQPSPTASRELTMVACGLGAVTGVGALGFGGFLAVTNGMDKDWGEAGAGLAIAVGGLLMLLGAGLLRARKRAGVVLMILAVVPMVAAAANLTQNLALAIAIAGFGLISAVLAWVVRSWCVPKQRAYPQQQWQQQPGYPQQPPAGYQQPPGGGHPQQPPAGGHYPQQR